MPREKHTARDVANQVERKNTMDNLRRLTEEAPKSFLPSGSALLNLALSGKWNGGWAVGRIANLIGDSSSGKSFIALTMLAELANQDRFDKYRLIYDDVEAANGFDMVKLFGQATAERIESPDYNDKEDEPIYSDTIQDWQHNIHDALDQSEPFVYILDSFDALTSEEEQNKVKEVRKARAKGKAGEISGSYKMDKPKILGQVLREIKRRLKTSKSTLIIVSQTRDNINPMSFAKKTRSGGRALKFYSSHELWTAEAGKVKRRDLIVGVRSKIKITKNKITGLVRSIELPIYYDYGVDDITANIRWLVDNGFWKIKKQTIEARGLGLTGTLSKLVRAIESKGLEPRLGKLMGRAWRRLEEASRANRKPKYK